MKRYLFVLFLILSAILTFAGTGNQKGAWDTSLSQQNIVDWNIFLRSDIPDTGTDITLNNLSINDTIQFGTATDDIYIYMSNDTLFFDSRIGSAYFDLSEMVVLFGAGTMNLDDIQPATNDSSSSQVGTASNPYGSGHFVDLWGDTLTIKNKLVTPDSVRFEITVQTLYLGGAWVSSTTEFYYRTSTVNDDIFTYALSGQHLLAGGTVVFDTVTVNIYTQGTEDSAHIYLYSNTNGTRTNIDSAWVGSGNTGWEMSSNILQNGDYTTTSNNAYRIYFDCVNNANNDIRFDSFIRFVYHLE